MFIYKNLSKIGGRSCKGFCGVDTNPYFINFMRKKDFPFLDKQYVLSHAHSHR